MDLEKLAAYVGIELPEAWVRCAPAAMAEYRPDWLDGLDFEYILDYYEFTDEYKQRFRRELALLRNDETLRRVCWLMHWIIFFGQAKDCSSAWSWGKSSVPASIGGHGTPVTCVAALLAGQPMHEALMKERCYDAEQIAIHKRGVRVCWVGEHEDKGIDGVRFGLMVWGTLFIKGQLVRLGRLQYQFTQRPYPTVEALLGPGRPVTNLHIPGGDGLKPEDVDASIAEAREKLPRYFPGIDCKKLVYYTHTWLLSPQLREFLPPESNIIRFQDRFTIVDRTEQPASFLGWVFNDLRAPGSFDYRTLPENNTMQREIKKRLIAGTPLEIAGGCFTLDE